MKTLSTLCITLLMSSFLLCRVSALADRDNILKTGSSEKFMRSQMVAVSQSRISDSANKLMSQNIRFSKQFDVTVQSWRNHKQPFGRLWRGCSQPQQPPCKKASPSACTSCCLKIWRAPLSWRLNLNGLVSISPFSGIVTVSPANSVETLSECEITKVLVLPTSVIALIMDSTAGTVGCKFQCLPNQNIGNVWHKTRNSPELFFNMDQWVFRVVKDDIERPTPITCLYMTMLSLWWERWAFGTYLKSPDLNLFPPGTLEEAILFNSVVHKLLKPLQILAKPCFHQLWIACVVLTWTALIPSFIIGRRESR